MGSPLFKLQGCPAVVRSTVGSNPAKTATRVARLVLEIDRDRRPAVSEPLQRIFSAEREGQRKLDDAERNAKEMEAAARARADEALVAAERDVKELLAKATEEARRAAETREAELKQLLDRRAEAWRERCEARRAGLVSRMVASVLGEGVDRD